MYSIKIFLLTAIPFFYFLFGAFAQNNGKISGNIISKTEKSVAGATVMLVRAKDSATIKLSVANKEGVYAFEKIADGKYRIAVTAVGHQKSFSDLIELNPQQPAIQVSAITLNPATKSLTDVNVVAKRQLVEQKIDRTVVNVDAS